jgi:AraC-like DNA-binding protein
MKTELGSNDLSFKLDVAGFKKQLTTAKSANIGQGTLQFSSSSANIHIHTCDLVEKQHFSSTAELDASLSINILLRGKVRYKLSQHAYEFSTTKTVKEQPVVFVNAINQPVIFTRFMRPNQQVKKVNITCDKKWLFERCTLPNDVELLNTIFNHNEQVSHWLADEEMLELAQKLISKATDKSLNNQLSSEKIAIEILQLTINKLNHLSKDENKRITMASSHKNSDQLLSQVSDLLEQKLSLEEIATKLAMSVSTLQRKFKTLYKITVIDYHRQKKLNQSRRHLVVDGLSIGETAYLAGYKYTSNFSHAFKQQFNLTPHEFLQQYKD